MPATMTPRVIDISHHNIVQDLKATAASGIWGVIHKSSQGKGYKDPDYATRRALAKSEGLLWGAYHFNDGSDVAAQVDWFIKCAAPDASTLLVLDFEDNPKSNMTVHQAVQFLRLIEAKTGRKAAIYSGNRLKETIHALNATDRAYVCSHRLWLCQYGPHAVLPEGFSSYWLWQYTGDGVGLEPHNVAGIVAGNRGLDLNVFHGTTREQLTSEWAPAPSLVAQVLSAVTTENGASSHSIAAAADQPDDAPGGEDTLPAQSPAATDPAAIEDDDLYAVKRRLKAMNYNPGVLNGQWGGMTAGAIAGFINDRGGKIAAPASLDAFNEVKDELRTEITRAEDQKPPFVRPVSEARANADSTTVAAVAPEVVPAKRSFFATISASITAFFAAFWNTVSGYVSQAWDFFTDHKDDMPTDSGWMDHAREYLAQIPSGVWFGLAGVGLLLVALEARKSVKKITEQVQTGARQ